MKKIILIALSLILVISTFSTFGIVAYASEENDGALPEISDDMGRIPKDAADLGLDYYTIWNAFPEEIDTTLDNNKIYFTDQGFTDAIFYSFANYTHYQLTLVDGKWQIELPADVSKGGGMVYAYVGEWNALYRGGTKESVYLEGENEFENLYKVEIMSHLFRIWTLRYIGDESVIADAYYTFDGELDYLIVETYLDGQRIAVYFNSEREATMAYDGSNYMLPDGNWYAGPSAEAESFEACEKFAGMSFEEVTALVPCLLYCGDHQPTKYSCEVGQYCTLCLEMIKAQSDHDWADATCSAPSTCKKCGDTRGDRIDHSYDATVVAPDCENDGYTLYTCGECGDNYTSDVTYAFGHTYDAQVIAPTCESVGYTKLVCCNCGDNYTSDKVDPLGHDWIDATYEAPKTCAVCGETDGDPLVKPEDSTDEPTDEPATEPVTEPEQNDETEIDEKSETESIEEPKAEPETEYEAESDKTQTGSSDNGKSTSGCGSAVGLGTTAIILAIGVFGFVFIGKKKEND